MSVSELTALLAVWIAAIASPGPDVLQIIRLGTRSRPAGVWAAVGIMTGNALWIVGSLLGLSALITTYPQILTVLQLLGGAYLLSMGYKAVRGGVKLSRQSPMTTQVQEQEETGQITSLKAWQQGLTTNLANPKAILFFGSVFAQFIRPEMGIGWAVVIAAILIVTGLVWFIGFALGTRWLAKMLVKNAAVIDMLSGLIFIALATFMVYEGARGVWIWLS